MDSDLICYQFSRSKVERADFSHFLSLYAPDKLPSGRRLREMMGQFLFCIEATTQTPASFTRYRKSANSIRSFTRRGPFGSISAILRRATKHCA